MRPFTQAWIICGLFVLPATVAAQQPPRVCDFEVEIRELVSRHDVIQRAQGTLSQLLREVPNDARYRVGGTFFPDGSERLRRDTISKFVSAARDFQIILKNVVIARKPECLRCDLRFYYFLADRVGIKGITEEWLIRNRGELDRIAVYRMQMRTLAQATNDARGRREEDILRDYQEAIRGVINRISDGLAPDSREAREFTILMDRTPRCRNDPAKGESELEELQEERREERRENGERREERRVQ